MKREYFGMLFMLSFVAIFFIMVYLLGEETMTNYLSKFIVIWILVAYYIGQYSMKFPKAF